LNHVEGIQVVQAPSFESRWGDSNRTNAEAWITLRGFKSFKLRVLNHVEGIQVAEMPRLESRWGDSSLKNFEIWITLRGFKLDKCWDLNHVEGIPVGKTYMTRITLRGFKHYNLILPRDYSARFERKKASTPVRASKASAKALNIIKRQQPHLLGNQLINSGMQTNYYLIHIYICSNRFQGSCFGKSHHNKPNRETTLTKKVSETKNFQSLKMSPRWKIFQVWKCLLDKTSQAQGGKSYAAY